jgi:hypothetical protein
MANPYYERVMGVNSTNPMGTSGFNRGSLQTLQNASRIMTNMSPQGNISDRLGASGNPEDDEDFIPLAQGTDTSLGYEAAIKVKQKRPGKRDREPAEAESNRSTRKDLHQNYAYKDRDITARGQEPQSMPQSRPDSYHEVKSERGPGKRDQAETESNRSYCTRQ